jgi:hypothetical protein
MPLAISGNGYQLGNGNVNDVPLGVNTIPTQTATTTATLTAAQITGRLLVGSPGAAAASYTLPTAALTDARLTNAAVGATFDLALVNLGNTSGVITILAGTGWTLVGLMTLAIATSSQFRALKTGVAAWTLYRIS